MRSGKFSEADIAHIAEEIESIGKAEKRALANRLKGPLMHLLEWQFQPGGRSARWRLTIAEQRREVVEHLAGNPSLKAKLPETMASAYGGAILAAARETNLELDSFPAVCPWSFEQATDGNFWPGEGFTPV